LELFTLSVYLLFDFIFALPLSLFLASINFFSDKNEICCFFQLNIVGIFCIGQIFFRSPEEVISSPEVPEGSTALREFNEGSAEIGNRF